MNKTKIEWCDYTWNPMIGCENNCSYCYARRIAKRFKMSLDWNTPQFFRNRLDEPKSVSKQSSIFVCSMGDLFGGSVPIRWIKDVIKVAVEVPWHLYIFLTKFPEHYKWQAFPDNCILGTTVTSERDQYRAEVLLRQRNRNEKFVSVEPLLGKVTMDFIREGIDYVIVGAQTGPGAVKPKLSWLPPGDVARYFFKESMIKHYPVLEQYRRKAWEKP